ncbi:hypothetical protein STRDD10_00427 [Streptococcus sp. DD10]|uniref:replication initiator protein A n=1 Tax=Streptococcus sp. DD10 TaxID=1777878 RepID=UPI000791CC0A|nr:replication initiator protein A [Streptococcus sp. DD10]KXT75153.1 hypothetical protein STRDD10_00427 [Streptococcus sp. DD10]
MADITVNQLATQTFYQIPQIFMSRIEKQYVDGKLQKKIKLTSRYAKKLSNDAKLAYGALYDRCLLSIKSYSEGKMDYVDQNGSVFLIFTIEDLMDLLDRGKTTVHKIKRELKEAGLLREVNQGANRPNRLYLQNVDASLQEYEHYIPEVIVKGRNKEEIIYTHVMTLDYAGNVIFEKNVSASSEGENGSSENERPTNPIKSSKNGSSKNERPKSDIHGVQILNGTNTENTNTEIILDNSSRKPAPTSDELDHPAGADDTLSQENSEKKFIKPEVYSLLQEIADSYFDHLPWDNAYHLTHRQKMQIGGYLETGWATSSEVLHCIERIPQDCQSPYAYLIRSVENLISERKMEAKILAHQQANMKYGV